MVFRMLACLAILIVASVPAPLRAQNAAAYVVGAILTLTGADVTGGLSAAAGLDVAVRHINATGGIGGHPLQVRVLDDGGSAERAVAMMHRLISESNVIAIVGPNQSVTARALEPAANEARVPLLSLAPAPPGTNAVLPWVFRLAVPEQLRAGLLVDYAKRHGFTRIGMLFTNDDVSRSAAALGAELSASAGLTVVDREQLASSGNADGEIVRALDKGTQAVLAFVDYDDALLVSKSLGSRAPTLAALGDLPISGPDFLHSAGKGANAWRVASAKLSVPNLISQKDPLYATISAFVKLYGGGATPNAFAGSARDAVTMLGAAINGVGTEPEKVRAALEGGQPLVGVMGVYRMTAANHAAVDAQGLTVVQGNNGVWKAAN